ncbi:hypothetical protein FIV00_15550 [Labrenzia sp. THAF82]|nr:hypothetical protein FIV00_15550 [Labrenzia sp. THAF82]
MPYILRAPYYAGRDTQAGFTTGQARLPAPRQRNPPIGDDWAGFSISVGADDGPGAANGLAGLVSKDMEQFVPAENVYRNFRQEFALADYAVLVEQKEFQDGSASGKPMRAKAPVSAIWRKRGGRWLQRYSQEIDTSLQDWQDLRTWLTRPLRCRPLHCAIGQSPAAVQLATDRCPGRAGHSRETPPG